MQSIYLYDNVLLEKTKEPGIRISTNLYFLPVDENNIAYKAAKLLMDEFRLPGGISISLQKYIPVAAGLAGGSSNAAAVLFGMNRMYGLGLNIEELMERGVKLGADVPYCIMRGTVLAEGIGEELTRLPALPKCYVLIAKPPISVSTKMVYEKLDGMMEALKEGDLHRIASKMGNVLEQVTVEEYPIIDQIKLLMKEAGALNAMMSGSGPTVFGLFDDRKKASKAMQMIREHTVTKQVYLTNIHGARRNI